MNEEKLKQLQIRADAKQRPTRSLWAIFLGVAVITGVALYCWWPRPTDDLRVVKGGKPVNGSEASQASGTGTGSGATGATNQLSSRSANPKDAVLTVSGYIINREQIELSPRFMGVVDGSA